MTLVKSSSLPNSPERLTELEAALVELRQRQEAQPKTEVKRRALLGILIQAFERRRDLVQATLEAQNIRENSKGS